MPSTQKEQCMQEPVMQKAVCVSSVGLMCKWKKGIYVASVRKRQGRKKRAWMGKKSGRKELQIAWIPFQRVGSLIHKESLSYLHNAYSWRILLLSVVLFLFLVSPTHRQAWWKVLTECTHIHTLTWEFMTPFCPSLLVSQKAKFLTWLLPRSHSSDETWVY